MCLRYEKDPFTEICVGFAIVIEDLEVSYLSWLSFKVVANISYSYWSMLLFEVIMLLEDIGVILCCSLACI